MCSTVPASVQLSAAFQQINPKLPDSDTHGLLTAWLQAHCNSTYFVTMNFNKLESRKKSNDYFYMKQYNPTYIRGIILWSSLNHGT